MKSNEKLNLLVVNQNGMLLTELFPLSLVCFQASPISTYVSLPGMSLLGNLKRADLPNSWLCTSAFARIISPFWLLPYAFFLFLTNANMQRFTEDSTVLFPPNWECYLL